MAKFERYDPRNKKKDSNKKIALDKDVKIKPLDSENKVLGYKLNEVMHDEYEGVINDDPQQLNG